MTDQQNDNARLPTVENGVPGVAPAPTHVTFLVPHNDNAVVVRISLENYRKYFPTCLTRKEVYNFLAPNWAEKDHRTRMDIVNLNEREFSYESIDIAKSVGFVYTDVTKCVPPGFLGSMRNKYHHVEHLDVVLARHALSVFVTHMFQMDFEAIGELRFDPLTDEVSDAVAVNDVRELDSIEDREYSDDDEDIDEEEPQGMPDVKAENLGGFNELVGRHQEALAPGEPGFIDSIKGWIDAVGLYDPEAQRTLFDAASLLWRIVEARSVMQYIHIAVDYLGYDRIKESYHIVEELVKWALQSMRTPAGEIVPEGRVSDFFRDIKLNLSTLFTSHLATTVKTLLTCLVTAKMFTPEKAKLLRTHIGVEPEKLSTMGLLEKTLDCVISIATVGEAVHAGDGIMRILACGDPVAEWFGSCNAVVAKLPRLYYAEPIEGHFDAYDVQLELQSLLTLGDQFLKAMAKTDQRYFGISRMVTTLGESYSLMVAEAAGKKRTVPIIVFVVGPPGVGKSKVVDAIIENHCLAKGRKLKEQMIYNRNTKDDFWSGAKNCMPIIKYSEPAATHKNIAKSQGDESMAELLSLADSAPKSLNMADLKDKGRTWANPELIIMDGNVLDLNLPVIVNNPAAVRRRIVYVSVTVKEEFRKTGSNELDVAKSLRLPEGQRWDVWQFNVWREHALSNTESESRYLLQAGSFAAMMKVMLHQFQKHIREQAQSLEMSKEFNLLTVVPDLMTTITDPVAAAGTIAARVAELEMDVNVEGLFAHALEPIGSDIRPEADNPLPPEPVQPNILSAAPNEDGDLGHIMCFYLVFVNIFALMMRGEVRLAANGVQNIPALYEAANFRRYYGNWFWSRTEPFRDAKAYALATFACYGWGNAARIIDERPGTVLKYPLVTAPFAKMLLNPVVEKRTNAQRQARDKFWGHFGYEPNEDGELALNVANPTVAKTVWCMKTCSRMLAASAVTYVVVKQMQRANRAEKTAKKYERFFDMLVEEKVLEPADTAAEGNVLFKKDSHGMSKEQAREVITAMEVITGADIPEPRAKRPNMKEWIAPPPMRVTERHLKSKAEIESSVMRNMLYVESYVGEHVSNTRALGICNSFIIINGHSVPDVPSFKLVMSSVPIERGFNRSTTTVFRRQVRRLPGDVCIVDVNVRSFKNIVELLPTELNLSRLSFIKGALVTDYQTINRLENVSPHPDLSLKQPETAMMFGVGPQFVATRVFTYDLPTHDYGMCGSALLLEYGGGVILSGIHVAGTSSNPRSYAQGLYGPDIRNAIKDLQESSVFSVVSEGCFRLPDKIIGFGPPHRKSLVVPRADAGLRYLGTLAGHDEVHAAPSKLTETPLKPFVEEMIGVSFYEDGHPKFGAPKMWATKNEEGVRVCPTERFVNKAAKPKKDLNPAVLIQTGDVIINHVVKNVRKAKGDNYTIKPLTMDVALNGHPHDAYIRSTTMGTSGGCMYPGPKRAHSDETELPFKADAYEPDHDVMAQVAEILLAYQRGERAMCPVGAQLKDEARSWKKVKEGKTRTFCMTNYDILLVARMYLAPIYTLMVEHGEIFGASIGINMHSTDVDKLVKDLREFSKLLMEGDYGDFDTSMPFGIGQCASRVVYEIARIFGYSPEALAVVRGLLSDGLLPIILLRGDLFEVPGHQPSGKYGTAEDNSLRGLCMLVYAFIMMATEAGWYADPDTAVKVVDREAVSGTDFEPEDFFENVLPRLYGDDLLNAVKEALQRIFNNQTYGNFCREVFGIDYTNALKTGDMKPFLDISEASFLKRKFVYREDLGHWVAPLDLNSLMKSIAFTLPSKAVSMEHQVYGATQSALRELFFHLSQAEYDARREVFARRTSEALGIKYEIALNGYPTFEQTRLQVFGEDEGDIKQQLATGDDE